MNMKPPKDDAEYFERLTKSVFAAGLNWTVVENKWPDFQKAFAQFSLPKVAKFNEKDVKTLMGNAGIVRNEKKIRATIHNAGEFLKLEKSSVQSRSTSTPMEKTRSDCRPTSKIDFSM